MMGMRRVISPRLHVLLAREATTAIVIRRGPSRHTAVIGWDRQSDTFQLGQWLYGRIYERRSDLSPDGRHLIYFAMNARWHSRAKGSWTAVSRAPYLKALCLFAKGDCWHGGGLFTDRSTYWLNDGYGHETLAEDKRLHRTPTYPWYEYYGGECLGIYYVRLQRDGWAMKGRTRAGDEGDITLFEKPVGTHWLLRKHAHATNQKAEGRGVYFDSHELRNVRTDESIAKPDWEWADFDGKRLLWAENGCLYAARLERSGLRQQKLLHDFRAMQFEKIAAPY